MLKSKKSSLSIEELNDYEMNSLEYEKALIYDNRTFAYLFLKDYP